MSACDRLSGSVRCPACGAEIAFAEEPTRLFDAKHEEGMHDRIVRVGSEMRMAGLAGFIPLNPWSPGARLVVVTAQIPACCGEAIWLKSFFSVAEGIATVGAKSSVEVTLVELTAFVPGRLEEYAGVHWLDPDLAFTLSGAERHGLLLASVEERAGRIAKIWAQPMPPSPLPVNLESIRRICGEPAMPLEDCPICRQIPDYCRRFAKGGEVVSDDIPEATNHLVRFITFKGYRSWFSRCPTCHRVYEADSEYEFLMGGSEDDDWFHRVSPVKAFAADGFDWMRGGRIVASGSEWQVQKPD